MIYSHKKKNKEGAKSSTQ